LTYVVKDAPDPAGTQASVSARCPFDTHLTGGGAYTSGGTVDDEVASSAPFDGADRGKAPDDGWLAEINGSASSDNTITSFAICAPFDNLRYAHDSISVGPNGTKKVHVACARGTRPLGGGALTTSSSTAISLRETFPWQRPKSTMPWDGWEAGANNLTNRSKSLTAYAVCRQIRSSEGYQTTASFDGVTSLNQTADTTPSCNPGLHTSGGGSFIDAGVQGDLATTQPDDNSGDFDSAPDNIWESWFNNETGTTSVEHGTLQFCVK
jgi:hypothetical protein